jgi:hypothetical protein
VVEAASHTTGIYGFTLSGESLPSLYIFSSDAAQEENFKFDPKICKGLPCITARYGNADATEQPSRVAVRRKGSMDTTLWHDLHRDVYLKIYKGRLSPEPVCDLITRKLLSGPLIAKTDSGPGRLSKEQF